MSTRPGIEPHAVLTALMRLTQQHQRERHTGEAMQALLRLRTRGREKSGRETGDGEGHAPTRPPEPQTSRPPEAQT